MAASGRHQIFLCAQKLQNLKSEIIQISLSHSPRYGDVQVTFSRFYWNSKWPPQINFNFFLGGGVKKLKNLKSKIMQILLSHSPRCGNVKVIFLRFYWNTKWPPLINFIFFVGARIDKLKSVIIDIVQSHCKPTIWKCACDFT